jgi:hypothetical protein
VYLGEQICVKNLPPKIKRQYYPPKCTKWILSISFEMERIHFRQLNGSLREEYGLYPNKKNKILYEQFLLVKDTMV